MREIVNRVSVTGLCGCGPCSNAIGLDENGMCFYS